MGLQNKNARGKFIMFIVGIMLAFGFICAMQFVDAKKNFALFACALLGMHGGVICFILSKKIFKLACDGDLKKHYNTEYALLALYLPLMLLKVIGVSLSHSTSVAITLVITAVALVVSFFNCKKLYFKLKEQP